MRRMKSTAVAGLIGPFLASALAAAPAIAAPKPPAGCDALPDHAKLVLSTANLYFPSQPGQSLYELTTTAPPNAQAVFAGSRQQFGQRDDPMVGKPIGKASDDAIGKLADQIPPGPPKK
jgi:hypothetical protein